MLAGWLYDFFDYGERNLFEMGYCFEHVGLLPYLLNRVYLTIWSDSNSLPSIRVISFEFSLDGFWRAKWLILMSLGG